MNNVRTRFAPSPTGFQHVGGFRSGIYAWLLARHHGGKFLLRVEDTDQERSVPGAVKFILQEFGWFGVDIDEGPSEGELKHLGEYWEGAPKLGGEKGPYVQSLRLARYREVAEDLIRRGAAYRCDCTPEMLEKERNEQMARKESPGYSGYCRTRNVSPDSRHVVRFKMPFKKTVQLDDAVKGRVVWESVSLKDPILFKSDGFATYHLAAMVDDHDMGITHVLRGDEWLPSAPLHILIYEALEWEKPVFAHLPVILGPDGKKLSKRHGAVSSADFREKGYLPEALLNYVILVGWSPGEGEEQEVFTKDELFKRFSLDHVNPASATFDFNKLSWMNGIYIRNLPVEEFLKRVDPFLKPLGMSADHAGFRSIAPLVQERVKTLVEVAPMIEFLFKDKLERELPAMFKQGIDKDKAAAILARAHENLLTLNDFTHEKIESVLRPLAEEFGLKVGPLFGVLRVAVMGKGVTPPLFESFAALGKEKTLSRIRETSELLKGL